MVISPFLCYNVFMNRRILQSKATTIYILYIFTVFLWYTHYKYFDIMQAKRGAFLLGTAAYDATMTIICIWPRGQNTEKCFGKRKWKWYRYLAIMLILVWILSTIGSIDIYEAVWGYGGKCTGGLIYLLGIIAAIYICENLEWNVFITWGMLLSTVVVCGLQG